MNPLMKNKVDVATMNEQEKQLFQKYGKLPKKNVLTSMQKERKYFDSGDYAMHKAGVSSADATVGSAIATPERLPHAQPPSLSSSPTNSSSMPYAHHHASSSSASAAPSGHVLSPSNSFSVSQLPAVGFAIPGASSSSVTTTATTPSVAKSPPRMASFSAQGGLSPTAGIGSGLNARRPSVGVGVASIPIPGVPVGGSVGGFDTSRISPPVAFSPLANAVPPSSFPIQSSHTVNTASATGAGGQAFPNVVPVGTACGAGGGHHHTASSFGHSASPVKPSHLKRGFDGEGVDEMAVED
ncbi:hypothetical protein QFC21_001584 [Naganishia friedmannii]|uniref:Uncharacterized protein n=1 Tax=Naganishia friedmannii TaxID=89922 RepID=A0ACC2W4T4_9TREE|nr:hypothetical protein QFC21_001584 [Naganishia friedmannii]